jgi:serine/threonine protein kinase
VVETVPAGTKLGRYEVLKQLAKGGMADLLLARTNGLEGFERHVVIKRIRAEQARNAKFVEMFVTEARLAGALHHHNIVQVQDIGEENGRHYFAMEYVHGEDLRKLLHTLFERNQKLPLEHLISIVATVAAALHHAHEAKGADGKALNIVHRDVTPANILVSYDGNIKVVDFGIAKAAASAVETDRGVLKGKVPYMTPEQCTGQKVDRRSDIFSLGIVAYELATSRRLFKGDTDFMTMSAIVTGEVPRPSKFRLDIPSKLEGIILKALARSPVDRFQTADEMRNALETYAARAGLRMSANSLAAYMKKLFGERPEPWLDHDQFPVDETTVDFDGSISGMAPAPEDVVETFSIPASIQATKSSPIRQAYSRALDGTPTTSVRPPKQLAQLNTILSHKREIAPMKPALPPPKTASKPPPVPEPDEPTTKREVPEEPQTQKRPVPDLKPRALTPDTNTAFGGETTDVDVQTTEVASPPPLPKVMVKEADKESTELVAPLVIDKGTRATATQKTHRVAPAWVTGAVVAGIALGGAGVYFVMRDDDKPHKPEPVEVAPAVEKPAPAPEPPKAPSDDIPWEQRTANNTPTVDTPAQPAQAEPAKAAPVQPATAPTAAAAEPPKPAPAKAEPAKAEPPKPEPPKVEPVKTAAAPQPPPAPKTETKPTPPAKPEAPAHVAAAKPTPKPATKPSKPATKTKPASPPQWDPDSLFLKKKSP